MLQEQQQAEKAGGEEKKLHMRWLVDNSAFKRNIKLNLWKGKPSTVHRPHFDKSLEGTGFTYRLLPVYHIMSVEDLTIVGHQY